MVGGAPLVVKAGREGARIGVRHWRRRVRLLKALLMRFRGSILTYHSSRIRTEAKGCDYSLIRSSAMRLWRRLSGAQPVIFAQSSSWRGGQHIATITPRERDIAIKAAQTLGLDVAGVVFYAPRATLMEIECLAGTGRYRKGYGRGYRGAR